VSVLSCHRWYFTYSEPSLSLSCNISAGGNSVTSSPRASSSVTFVLSRYRTVAFGSAFLMDLRGHHAQPTIDLVIRGGILGNVDCLVLPPKLHQEGGRAGRRMASNYLVIRRTGQQTERLSRSLQQLCRRFSKPETVPLSHVVVSKLGFPCAHYSPVPKILREPIRIRQLSIIDHP